MSQTSSRSQLSRFLLVGGSTVLLDLLLYKVFLMGLAPSPAKSLSFLLGTVYAYQFNRVWTFKAGSASLPQALKFGLVYGTNLGINVGTNAAMLSLLPLVLPWRLNMAFLVATATSATLNFLGMKWLVFNPRNKPQH